MLLSEHLTLGILGCARATRSLFQLLLAHARKEACWQGFQLKINTSEVADPARPPHSIGAFSKVDRSIVKVALLLKQLRKNDL
eukprot:scaffold201739_cov36-Tisochrysis_lutea.AAC.1